MNYHRRKSKIVLGWVSRTGNGVFMLNIFLSTLVVGLFVGYLAINNQAAANGFTVRSLEKKIAELRDQGNRLDLQIVALQAMNNVERQVGELGFVPIDQLDYISATPAAVAIK